MLSMFSGFLVGSRPWIPRGVLLIVVPTSAGLSRHCLEAGPRSRYLTDHSKLPPQCLVRLRPPPIRGTPGAYTFGRAVGADAPPVSGRILDRLAQQLRGHVQRRHLPLE